MNHPGDYQHPHPNRALQEQVGRIVKDARTHILDKVLMDIRTYIHDYIVAFEGRYGPIELVPQGTALGFEEFEDTHPGGSTSFHEILVNAVVETCGSVVTRSMKMEMLVVADQMEAFMEYVVMNHGAQSLYNECIDFYTHQIKKYLGGNEALRRLFEYCIEHDGNLPRVPAGPHYPF